MTGPHAVLGALLLAAPASPLQALLERAATRLEGHGYTHFTQTETEEDINDEGHVVATRKCKSDIDAAFDGGPHGEVLQAWENGEDITPKIRKFRAERAKKKRAEGKPENGIDLDIELQLPFERSQQARYDFTATELDQPTVTVKFKPKNPDSRAWVGEATVDTGSGRLVALHGRPSTLPRFVDRVGIEMEFGPEVPGGTVPSKLTIDGAGSFLMFDKRMRYSAVNEAFR